MAYWWVSQNQTFEEEHDGGYLWAPTQNASGAAPHHWASMRRVSLDDTIFSYVGMKIVAVGIAKGLAQRAPRPFKSSAGEAWQREGLRIDVAYDFLDPPIPLGPIAQELQALLPTRYSPLTHGGTGVQGYLFALPEAAGDLLLRYVGRAADAADHGVSSIGVPEVASSLQTVWRARRALPSNDAANSFSAGSTRHSAQAKRVGDHAEKVALEWLRLSLPDNAAETLRHVAAEGKQPGWDIEYTSNGRRIAVEVKGTTTSSFAAIEITANEWAAAQRLGRDYCLLLVARCMTPTPVVIRLEDPFAKSATKELRVLPVLWRLERLPNE